MISLQESSISHFQNFHGKPEFEIHKIVWKNFEKNVHYANSTTFQLILKQNT